MKRFIALRMLILTMLAVVVLFVGTVMLVETIVSIHTISTNESPGFVEEKFASLKVGMTVNETVALLVAHYPKSREVTAGKSFGTHSPKSP